MEQGKRNKGKGLTWNKGKGLTWNFDAPPRPLDLVNETIFQYLNLKQQVIKETTGSKSKQLTCSRGVDVFAADARVAFIMHNIVQFYEFGLVNT